MARMGIGPRAGTALLLAGLVMGPLLGLAGCGGSGGVSLPTLTSRSVTAPTIGGSTSEAESPSEAATPSERPTRTTPEAPAPTSSEAPPPPETSTKAPPPPETRTVVKTATATVSQSAAVAVTSSPATTTTSGGVPTWGWILLIAIIAAVIGAWLFSRSRRRSGWDADAAALETDTRTVTGTQVPPVLTAETPGERALSWPPVRAAMIDLVRRWDLLAQSASDDARRDQAGRIRALLQELVAAVDAENDALATGRNWTLLRPRVDEARTALSAALAGGPQAAASFGGPPGPPPPGSYGQPPGGPPPGGPSPYG